MDNTSSESGMHVLCEWTKLAISELREVFSSAKNIQRWGIFIGEWSEVPGDGNVYDHQRNQARLVKRYWKLDIGYIFWWYKITPEDIFKLRILSHIHDLWECSENTWDVNAVVKEGSSEEQKKAMVENERRVFNAFLMRVIPSNNSENDPNNSEDDPNKKSRDHLRGIYDIDQNTSHELSDYFKLHEKFSYLTWAFNTFQNREKWVEYKNELTLSVIARNLKYILSMAAEEGVPSCIAFIRDNSECINSIFNSFDPHLNKTEVGNILSKAAKLAYPKDEDRYFKTYNGYISSYSEVVDMYYKYIAGVNKV